MTRRPLAASILALACAFPGCNGSSSNSGRSFVADGPHDGLIIPLPGDSGFAEVLNQEATSEGTPRRGRVPMVVVVYFLGPDKKAPLSPAPTAVNMKILGATTEVAITLGPSPDPKDPAAAGRFASQAGELDLAGRRARLTADLASGQKFEEEFQGPR